MKLPIEVHDLKDKVVVVTGAGGVLCSMMSKALASAGAKVALLDLHKVSADKYVEEIRKEGGIAFSYEANVLDKESLKVCHEQILKDLGSVDILLNGAGVLGFLG